MESIDQNTNLNPKAATGNILDKLRNIQDKNDWNNWTIEEKKEILKIYYLICNKEHYLFKLVYDYNGSDTWEDIFRDYDPQYLDDKTNGVEDALNMINEIQK